MNKDQTIALQKQLKDDGFYDGPLDGIAGPLTHKAHAAWLEWKNADVIPAGTQTQPEHREPVVVAQALNHWPSPADVPTFFSRHELDRYTGMPTERWQIRNLMQIRLPFPMRLAWSLDTTVSRLTCHKLVARDLGKILDEILAHYGSLEAVREARMDILGGCYNYRPKRGGSSLSLHAWGAAIDLDPDNNPFQSERSKSSKATMPADVVAIFKRHGWTWGGDWSRPFDPMHFQATSKV